MSKRNTKTKDGDSTASNSGTSVDTELSEMEDALDKVLSMLNSKPWTKRRECGGEGDTITSAGDTLATGDYQTVDAGGQCSMSANLQIPDMSTIDCTLNQLASLLFDYKKRKEIEPTKSKSPAKDSKQQPTEHQNGVNTCTSDDFQKMADGISDPKTSFQFTAVPWPPSPSRKARTERTESPSKVATNPFESPSNSMKPDASPSKTTATHDASPSKTTAKSVASPIKASEKVEAFIQTTKDATKPAPTPTKATAATTEAAKVEVPSQTTKDATGKAAASQEKAGTNPFEEPTPEELFQAAEAGVTAPTPREDVTKPSATPAVIAKGEAPPPKQSKKKKPFVRIQSADSHLTSLQKAISWRGVSSLTTVLIAYFVVNDASLAFKIGFIEVFAKIILYYLHERFWITAPYISASIDQYFNKREEMALERMASLNSDYHNMDDGDGTVATSATRRGEGFHDGRTTCSAATNQTTVTFYKMFVRKMMSLLFDGTLICLILLVLCLVLGAALFGNPDGEY